MYAVWLQGFAAIVQPKGRVQAQSPHILWRYGTEGSTRGHPLASAGVCVWGGRRKKGDPPLTHGTSAACTENNTL